MPAKTAKSHLKEIVLLFSVPVAIVALLIAFVQVPRLFANPAYDFLYCQGYDCESEFSVDSNGKIISETKSHPNFYRKHGLYHYDISRDATRRLSPAEADAYRLNTSSKAPDGYTLERNSSGGSFLFSSGYRDSWQLKNGMAKKPLSIEDYEVHFIGWVVENE